MKRTVSIPDDVFEDAQRLARRTNKSWSQLFNDAIREYVARHAIDDVTLAMGRACAGLGQPADDFVSLASGRLLEKSEW